MNNPESVPASAKAAIEIRMLGGFSISEGGGEINDSLMRTHQLWRLMEYLITFRNKTVSQGELIAVLWPDKSIDNPANALKNLVYRVRAAFAASNLPHAKEMIVYDKGGYRWNNHLNYAVDTDIFEDMYKKASDTSLPADERLAYYRNAVALYEGDFLPGARYESWVIPVSSYYRSVYLKCFYTAADMLGERALYREIEEICRKTLGIDRFEEKAHIYLLLSLANQGKQREALSHYRNATDMFFRELGVSLSGEMRSVYMDIAKTVHEAGADIETIRDDLRENSANDGAFYCEYEVFKSIYRLEARSAARAGQSVFISLLSVECRRPDKPLGLKTLSKLTDSLYNVIKNNLRRGDVFARYSASQFILMLPTFTYENCEIVTERIIKKCRQAFRSKDAVVLSHIQPVEPLKA